MGLIDTHAHLTDSRFEKDVDEVISRAFDAGIEAIVTVGTDVENSRVALALAERHPNLYATVGIHPHAASTFSEQSLATLRELARSPLVVAIGETGLDFHYDNSPREDQRLCLARHLELGCELGLPIVVHAREADDDLVALLRAAPPGTRGVLHSFSSGPELLELALELGWHISFSGMLTFAKFAAADLLRRVPLERLLLETDSPYLSPAPLRGERNEPRNVTLVASRAAELRDEDPAALVEATTRNARALFGLEG